MSEKIVLIDGHKYIEPSFLRAAGSDQFGRTSHKCRVWLSEYHDTNTGRREASVPDCGF